ncbi:MAG TPA: BNR-4 repeat-containing protein [Verrucomicrobiae bacterium]|nr:BNR-4 repeat-containing protein [Verrucomicrobiae bacterium]
MNPLQASPMSLPVKIHPALKNGQQHLNRPGFSYVFAASIFLILFSCFTHAAILPYNTDVNTLHLWHFDESSAPAIDSMADGTNLNYMIGGATFGNSSAEDFTNCISFGTLATSNAVIYPTGSGFAGTAIPFSFAGTDGAFTFEALIQIGFNPISFIRNQPCQIMNCDANGVGTRVFQLRLDPVGYTGGGGDTNFVRIEFINGATTVAMVPVPTNGPDAIVSNNWYHIAVTYNGSADTTSNLLFYWTLLDTNRAVADCIYGATMASGLPGLSDATTIFSIGNSARNPAGNAGNPDLANFPGKIDEVRISDVARAANEFVFQNISVTASSYQAGTSNYPENTLDGNPATRWSAEGDGQSITYDLGRVEIVESVDLSFYQPNTVRTNWFDVLLSNDGNTWRYALTNAVGTNAMPVNFDFADWPARYVRVVGHLNSQNDFNSITETVIHYSVPVDADSDGLPDLWETYYFGNLANSTAGDPDNDGQSNAYEFLHGTDPTVYNVASDTDGDGLPDTWEMTYFNTLAYGANDDPDHDGSDDLQEYLAGSNPMDANSIPGDINGNNLPDIWETNVFGALVESAYDDADGDGYNNLAEMVWGTGPTNFASHPSFVAPRVALLGDSVVTTNACLMPKSGPYGRAINGISFQTRALLDFDGYEYTAWYDTTGSGSSTTQTVWLARRTVTNTVDGPWEKFNTGSTFINGKGSWDAHDVISLGISPIDGTLHMSWDMHGNTLRYRRSVMGLCTTNKAAWGTAGMMNPEQNWLVASGQSVGNVTYPMFINNPSKQLLFEYRIGNTTAGDHYLNTYIPGAGNWTAGIKFTGKQGTYTGMLATGNIGSSTSRNPYENNFDFAPDGTLHHTWTYREAADAANHDIDYAYSTNNGVTWFNNGGTNIADTGLGQSINVNSSGITIKVLDSRQRLINQQAQCVDNDGRVHVLMLHRRAEPDAAWVPGDSTFSVLDTAYYHYFRDPITHVWSQRRIPWTVFPVGSRPKLGYDASGNLYAVYLSYASTNTDVVPGYTDGRLVIATASKASQYTDWQVVCSLTNDFNGEPLIDQARLLADNILSVFIQENSSSTGVVGTPLHVLDFGVNVTTPDSLALNFFGNDSVILINAATGHMYQLQSTSTLSPSNWTTVGPVTSGINGILGLPDPNSRGSASQHFYRVITDP